MKPIGAFLILMLLPVAGFALDSMNEITAANVVELMNLYRMEEGLQPLNLERRLSMAARDRMKHMEEIGFWSHESPEGLPPFVWLPARAYNYSTAAENLAAGYETAKVLVQSWMESPGHRANIVSPDFRDCGIAIIDGSTLGPATGKSIVVLFGSERRTLDTNSSSIQIQP